MSDPKKFAEDPIDHPISLLKHGYLLKYKKRILKSNWMESEVVLLSNATIIARNKKRCRKSETKIQMTEQTTIIIFGKQLKDVPKTPDLPPGFRMEQLIAIGLIHSLPSHDSKGRERLTITFHWFLPLSLQDLFEWIIAINNSIPNNKQILSDDHLTLSLVMAEALHYNNMLMMSNPSDTMTTDYVASQAAGSSSSNGWQSSGTLHHQSGEGVDYISSENYANDYGGDVDFDCGDFDDCSAFTAADAFGIL